MWRPDSRQEPEEPDRATQQKGMRVNVMNYTTHEDIQRRIGELVLIQLTDDAGAGTADSAVIEDARQQAEAEVNSYVARRYGVPVNTTANDQVAAVLKATTLDVIEYRLHARRPFLPDDVATRYRAALTWLARVGAGEIFLPTATELPASAINGVVAMSGGNAAVLSRDELAGL